MKINCTMNIQHDGPLDLAVGRWRMEKTWSNKSVTWSTLVKKLQTTTRTAEKHAEYLAAKRARQDEIKDIGGFVGGYLTGGRRKSGSVQHRQLVTLDLDFAQAGFWTDFRLAYGCAAVMYSTHKHSPDKPRYRLVIPLDREVFADEYVAISRKIAGELGIDFFDDTTFQPERLMYWPSTSADAEYIFEFQDGPWLQADDVLGLYHNWKDSSEWPVSSRHKDALKRAALKAGDPLEKPGIIGAWCRTYSIVDVIEGVLEDVYEPCDVEGRYTYREGSTAGGLVLYEDKWAYSHHGTDPASGKLCNAFDLVRLHKFGLLDEEARAGTPGNKLPSFVAMTEFAQKDGAVRTCLVNERIEGAKAAFDTAPVPGYDEPEEWEKGATAVRGAGKEANNEENTHGDNGVYDETWKEQLDVDKRGALQSTIDNIVLVLENDPALAAAIGFDEFEMRPVARRRLPWRPVHGQGGKYWRDTDDANLAHYLERVYGLASGAKIEKAMGVIYERHRVHPVREYLGGLVWDGQPRIETLFIDYLGAEDTPLTRVFARKMMAAAVTRVFEPGCKFDYTVVLIGKQGDKKSTLLHKLGGSWFSDTLTTVQGKEALEQLQGVWIMEIAELAGFRKAEQEAIKHFISKQVDKFRAAYLRHGSNYYRQLIFVGTTNRRDFLQDITGNRRYWPVETGKEPRLKDPARMAPGEVAQLWAEAVTLYKAREPLYLDDELEAQANALQTQHMEQDDRRQMVIDYLETLLPEGWENMFLMERRAFLTGGTELVGTRQRTRVTVGEIWTEALGCMAKDMTRYNTGPIHTIMAGLPDWERHYTKMNSKRYGVQTGYVRKGENVIRFSHVPEIL